MASKDIMLLKITRTVYVRADEADIEQVDWDNYFFNCDCYLHRGETVTEEGTPEQFGLDREPFVLWGEDEDDDID